VQVRVPRSLDTTTRGQAKSDVPSDFPFTWWRLPSGGGVQLSFIDGVVTMELGSKKTADRYELERKYPELRRG